MRKCCEEEKEQILRYIGKEPEMNLFFYGDIENFGVDTKEVSVFVNEKDLGWDSILLRYYDMFLLYSEHTDYEVEPVLDLLKQFKVDCISGKTELITRLTPYYPSYHMKDTFMCRCKETAQEEIFLGEEVSIRRMTIEDIPRIISFYTQIEEFADSYAGKEESIREREEANMTHGGITLGIFVKDELATLVGTSAANSICAMVVGVATQKKYRKNGYALAAVSKLCQISFQEGKQFLCLFYNNEVAGRIYKKVGFREVGKYAMLQKPSKVKAAMEESPYK